jgi:hypothetical protein
MSQNYQYVTIDTVLAKFHRDFGNTEVGESDMIEWIGEALSFMKVTGMQEEAIAFIEVKNYQCLIPNGLHHIIQVARDNQVSPVCPVDVITTISNGDPVEECLTAVDCHGNLIGDYEVAHYRPYFDLQYNYYNWNTSSMRQEKFTPIRLANHTFFNTLVCKDPCQQVYDSCENGDEYTIISNQLRFSFKEGSIALAYLRQQLDPETGYPMIPDDISVMSAINYYMGWKFKERECWSHREGSCALADKAEKSWLKYVRQAKNKAMMPHGVDQYQNILEQSIYMIPRFNKYYGFFGKLGKAATTNYNDPDNRNNTYKGQY